MTGYGARSMTDPLRRVLVRAPQPADAARWSEYGWRAAPDPAAAADEHEELRRLLEEAGAEVIVAAGEPGFVRVLDEHTIAFPLFDGNGMYLSAGNLTTNARVGLLFLDFEGQRRLRLNGVASVDFDDPLLAEYPRAQCVVRVLATEVFPNCPRYIHKLALVERSRFTPRADCEPPVPDWKRREWARDVLPAGDPAVES